MSLMTVNEVAAFLGVQDVRVERLERESLLVSKEKDTDGNPLFDSTDVERYKNIAERLGGI
jgi:DNA-binding transcriptional MerR regulator